MGEVRASKILIFLIIALFFTTAVSGLVLTGQEDLWR